MTQEDVLFKSSGILWISTVIDVIFCFSVTLYGVFTNHSCMGVATRCLLLELLDVSVSDLLVRRNIGTQGGRYVNRCQDCSLGQADMLSHHPIQELRVLRISKSDSCLCTCHYLLLVTSNEK